MFKVGCIATLFSFCSLFTQAQDDLLSLIPADSAPQKEYIINAFKSSRVINGHSMEMIGKGILDTRILHRFGTLNSGFSELFGLDQANMRFGLDYGVSKNLTVGIGRSNVGKEWDGFIKYRLLHQSTGSKRSSPVSLIWVSGMTWNTQKWSGKPGNPTDRLAYYHQLIIGRKFSEAFSAQLSPTLVHQNLILPTQPNNDIAAVGMGARLKLTNAWRLWWTITWCWNRLCFPLRMKTTMMEQRLSTITSIHFPSDSTLKQAVTSFNCISPMPPV
jgi:hypothetical protein